MGKENGFSLSRPVTGWHSPEPMDPIYKHAPKEGTEMTERACEGELPSASNNLYLTSNGECMLQLFYCILPFVSLSIGLSPLNGERWPLGELFF